MSGTYMVGMPHVAVSWAQCSVPRSTGLHARPFFWRKNRTANRISDGFVRDVVCVKALPPTDVFVLDADGVLWDSEAEVARNALATARELWPDVQWAESDDKLLRMMKSCRPVLVEAYEYVLIARLLAENPAAESEILKDWPTAMEKALTEFSTTADEIGRLLDTRRDSQLQQSEAEWVKMHVAYRGIVSALNDCTYPFYIASSKSAPRAAALLRGLLGQPIPVDSPRLYAGLIPPGERKTQALQEIISRPIVAETGAQVHFIDDRLETLEHMASEPTLRDVRLYFATWGYSTPEEKARARNIRGEGGDSRDIVPIDLEGFGELLRWGIVMGVDDGCEPEPHEVEEAVHGDFKRKFGAP